MGEVYNMLGEGVRERLVVVVASCPGQGAEFPSLSDVGTLNCPLVYLPCKLMYACLFGKRHPWFESTSTVQTKNT